MWGLHVGVCVGASVPGHADVGHLWVFEQLPKEPSTLTVELVVFLHHQQRLWGSREVGYNGAPQQGVLLLPLVSGKVHAVQYLGF